MRHVKVRVYRRNPSRKRRHSKKRSRHVARRRHNPFARSVRRARSKSRRRNPMRARSHKKSHRRRNPGLSSLKGAFSGSTLKRAAALAVGFLGGRQVMTLLASGTVFGKQVFTPPAFMSSVRPGLGLVNIVLGVFLAKKAKGAFAKDAGMGLVAAGGVDVLTALVNMASPGLLGIWIDDRLQSFNSPSSLGMGLTRVQAPGLGRVGRSYSVSPKARLAGSMGGYDESSFSAVDSSFPAG